jgi:uncharacterized membrane protein
MHQLLFRDEDVNWRRALRAELLQKGLCLPVRVTLWLLAAMASLMAAERTQLLYERWSASTSAALVIAGLSE